jgi:DNA-binding CsgD family transcriptional regulator
MTDTAPDLHLSPREREIIMLTVEGLTARQIARRLVLSPRTVEHYIQGVRDRFELPNRATLVVFALSHEVMAR